MFTIAIDFDGTIAKHYGGDPVPGAFEWMAKFQAAGADLVLWTMRYPGGIGIDSLREAVLYCRSRGIEFYDHNPDQIKGRSSKAKAQVYIDDLAFGCPLRRDTKKSRPYVDWEVVGPGVMKLMEEHHARYARPTFQSRTSRLQAEPKRKRRAKRKRTRRNDYDAFDGDRIDDLPGDVRDWLFAHK